MLKTRTPLKAKTPLKRTPFKKAQPVKREKRVKNVLPPLTAKQKRELGPLLLNHWGNCCWYCRTPLTLKTMTFDHVKARSLGGDHSLGNLLPACFSCNCVKGSRSVEWMIAQSTARRKSAKVVSHIPVRHTPNSINRKGAK